MPTSARDVVGNVPYGFYRDRCRNVGTGIARPGGRGRPPLRILSEVGVGKFILYYFFFFLYSFSPILYLPTRTTIGRPYDRVGTGRRGGPLRPPDLRVFLAGGDGTPPLQSYPTGCVAVGDVAHNIPGAS